MNLRSACVLGVSLAATAISAPPFSSDGPWIRPPGYKAPKPIDPKIFANAVEYAFKHGLADPKGGELHEVTITSENGYGQSAKFKVTGWLMPAKGRHKAYVSCWNGLPYHEYELGPNIDLDSFMKDKVAEATKIRKNPWWEESKPEYVEASQPLTLVGKALLLRINRPDLAAKITFIDQGEVRHDEIQLKRDIVWFRVNRAIHARNRNDDLLCKEDCEWLIQHSAALRDKASKNPGANQLKQKDYQALLEDSTRRIGLGNRRPFDPIKNKELSIDKRVAQIIEYLDEAKIHQWLNDDATWYSDPVYQAACDVGEPMLEALVDSAEKDRRLMRQVGFGSPSRSRGLVPIRKFALTLVRDIISFQALPQQKNGEIDFKALRTQIKAIKGLGLADRYFAILKMDGVGHEQWFEAAESLVQLETYDGHLGSIVLPEPNDKKLAVSMVGEAARNRQNPSVSDVMNRRALQVFPKGKGENPLKAVRFAKILAMWDASGGLQTFNVIQERLESNLSHSASASTEWTAELKKMIAGMIRYRTMAGDPEATALYERTITNNFATANYESVDRLLPLIYRPEWGNQVAARLFLGKDAPRNIAQMVRRGDTDYLSDLLWLRLTRLESVRTGIIEALGDQTVIGSVWSENSLRMYFNIESGRQGDHSGATGGREDSRDPQEPSNGPLRVCDLVALELNSIGDVPRFRMFWSIKDRDAAIQEIIAFIPKNVAKLIYLHYPVYGRDELGY